MSTTSTNRGRRICLQALLGWWIAFSLAGPSGIWGDRTRSDILTVHRSPLPGRVTTVAPVLPPKAAASPSPALPRFVGTEGEGSQARAIFQTGERAPLWFGRRGERIRGTEYLVESFDEDGATLRHVRQ
jgi:hypothetical protein